MRKGLIVTASLAFALLASAGVASLNVQAQADWVNDFTITEASVRLGEANSTTNPTGLRFKVNTPENLKEAENTECYTVLSFTSSALGEATEYNLKVPATVWREDGSGWNAVLLGIPASDFVTEVTATSYVAVNGEVVHTSNTATTSIAKTSSILLNGGAKDAQLDTFVSTIETEITLNKESATFNQLNTGAELTASLPEAYDGYAVTWKSSNESVATVDKNGNVTAVGNGSATISANLGNNTATFAATAQNMAITFSEEAPVAPITRLGSTKSPTSTELATLSVVDFNGGKAFGNSSFTGQADTFPLISYSALKTYFDAYPTAVAVTFDAYTVGKPAYWNVFGNTNLPTGAGNNNFVTNLIYQQEDIGDYWKSTVVVTRSFFYSWPADLDMNARFRQASGINEMYIDNFGAIKTEYPSTTVDFETNAMFQPIGRVGSTPDSGVEYNGSSIALVSIDGAEKTNMLKSTKNVLPRSTGYFHMDGAYLEKVFANKNITHLQFDIIGDWNGTIANLQIQDNTYTSTLLASGADATAVTVDGASGYYKLTVLYSREQFETTKKANDKYASYGNQVIFRYVYGGNVKTAAYFDNFKGVTVHNVLSDSSYGTGYTVSANRETGATYTATSSTYQLCFDQNTMVDAFYTQGAESISFTLEAEGYDIVGFRTWSGSLVYCRPIIHFEKADGTMANEALNNATIEIVDGKAIITIAASEFTTYFDANGDYIAGSHSKVPEGLGFGMRLSVLWGFGVDADGKQNEVIPSNTVYTMSNFTLNF